MRSRESDTLEGRHITQAVGHTPEQLRDTALKLASVVYDPDGDEESQAAQVEDLSVVLAVLGYRVKMNFNNPDYRTDSLGRIDRHHRAAVQKRESVRKARRYEKGETEVTETPTASTRAGVRRHGLEPVCGSDRGTLRGYNRHITAYNTACPDCVSARQAELDERWTKLGIKLYDRGEVVKR